MDEDEAVSRMRAADPAAATEPDAERLAGLTAERRADELAARRTRRSPRWGAVAAAAVGALVVGGAGYGLGRSGEEPATQATIAHVRPGAATEEGPARADTMASAGGFAGSYVGPGAERMTFTAQGLSDEAGTASAWALDGASTFGEEHVLRVAEVFGVDGQPRLEGAWTVGPTDGSGPTLTLSPDGSGTLMYQDPELYRLLDRGVPEPLPVPDDGAAEPGIEPGSSGEGSSGDSGVVDAPPDSPVSSTDGGVEPTPADDEPATPTGDEPTPADDSPDPAPVPVQPLPAPVAPPADEPSAVEPDGSAPDGPAGVLYETLAALGLDPEAAEYQTEDHWTGDEAVSVVAHQVLEGRRTGLSWRADVVEGELYSFTGPIAPLVELGEYDVVSPAEAVDRLADPRFGGTPVWRGEIGVMPAVPGSPGRSWDDPPGPPPEAGDPIPWPVTDVSIVRAEPALTQQYTNEGSTLLLPAYELSDADGRTWSVLAVAGHELAS